MTWIIVSIIALILQQFLPWWSIGIAGLLFGFLIDQRRKMAFINGFFGIFLLWGGTATYIYFVNEGVLANRLALMTNLPHGFLLIIITGFTGGIVAGLASLSGRYLREISRWKLSSVREK
jgi:hypothetical protein